MKLFDEFWEAWKYDPASIDEAFEQCFKAGMLAAADIVTDSPRAFRLDREGVANKIREVARGND